MTLEVKWQCPKCGANSNDHKGAKNPNECFNSHCMGFVCECEDDSDGEINPSHGTHVEPCHSARCYHCEWEGTFPAPLKGLLPWEKKAMEAGWGIPDARLAEILQVEVAKIESKNGKTKKGK